MAQADAGADYDADGTVRTQIMPRADECFHRAIKKDRALPLPAKIIVRVRVAPSGQVDESAVASATGGGPALPACLAAAARQAKFEPPGGEGFTIEIPFSFKRGGL